MRRLRELAAVALVAGLVGVPAASGVVSGSVPTTLRLGFAPFSMATGDFNSDGHRDLAVLGYAGKISIRLGTGGGRFVSAPGSPFRVPSTFDVPALMSIAVGDFNGDGHPDLVVGDDHGYVYVLLGNGTGRFRLAPGSPLFLDGLAQAFAVGDFNHDHKLDVAAALDDGHVWILLGNGAGGLQVASTTSPPAGSRGGYGGSGIPSVAVGDFNHDGKLDVATSIYQLSTGRGGLSILLGDGHGGLASAPGSPHPLPARFDGGGLAVGDFNHDGQLDVAVSSFDSGTLNGDVSVFLGGGSGRFHGALDSPAPVKIRVYGLTVGDFNGDGRPDLILGGENDRRGDDEIVLLHGRDAGRFKAPVTVTTTAGRPITLATLSPSQAARPNLAVLVQPAGERGFIRLLTIR